MPSTILHLFLPDRPRDGEGRSPAQQLAHLLGPEASGLLTLLEESDTALTFWRFAPDGRPVPYRMYTDDGVTTDTDKPDHWRIVG